MKSSFFFILIFFISFSAYSNQNWKIVETINEGNQNKTFFLISNKVLSIPGIDGPFKNTYSAIMFKCDANKKLSSFFGFTNKPNIKNNKTEGMFNVVSTTIKYDDKKHDINLYNPRRWRSNFYLTNNNNLFVKKLINTKNVSLEINWVNQGLKYFTHNTSGFLENYNNLKKACGL